MREGLIRSSTAKLAVVLVALLVAFGTLFAFASATPSQEAEARSRCVRWIVTLTPYGGYVTCVSYGPGSYYNGWQLR